MGDSVHERGVITRSQMEEPGAREWFRAHGCHDPRTCGRVGLNRPPRFARDQLHVWVPLGVSHS